MKEESKDHLLRQAGLNRCREMILLHREVGFGSFMSCQKAQTVLLVPQDCHHDFLSAKGYAAQSKCSGTNDAMGGGIR